MTRPRRNCGKSAMPPASVYARQRTSRKAPAPLSKSARRAGSAADRSRPEYTANITKLLIANRGEIAIRVARAAADMGLPCVGICSDDDSHSLHVRIPDDIRKLPGRGAPAYLDIAAVIAAAKDAGCDAIHPCYGFLAERADFAHRCAEAALTFIGPDVSNLELFGHKAQAR